CASGATWVSIHHGGGVGIGYSQHAGMVIVCDGTEDASRRIERVLWNDPASGVMRHADAGYEDAIACARDFGLDLPGILAGGRALSSDRRPTSTPPGCHWGRAPWHPTAPPPSATALGCS